LDWIHTASSQIELSTCFLAAWCHFVKNADHLKPVSLQQLELFSKTFFQFRRWYYEKCFKSQLKTRVYKFWYRAFQEEPFDVSKVNIQRWGIKMASRNWYDPIWELTMWSRQNFRGRNGCPVPSGQKKEQKKRRTTKRNYRTRKTGMMFIKLMILYLWFSTLFYKQALKWSLRTPILSI
jgi:hypothetical protein